MSAFGEFLKAATEVALAAGKGIREAREKEGGFVVDVKAGVDLVTSADRASEELIIGTLKRKFPDHCFIGEESANDLKSNADGSLALTDAPTWIIDPIDGTTNYVHGLTDSCVSIGLAMNKEVDTLDRNSADF
jgi:fructose-1,6-bisphosphatase/inositol monophosphatase family enzyme